MSIDGATWDLDQPGMSYGGCVARCRAQDFRCGDREIESRALDGGIQELTYRPTLHV